MTISSLVRRIPSVRTALEFLLPFVVLVVFLEIGRFTQSVLGTWVPGSVIGMGLLFVALSAGLVKDGTLDRVSDWLLDRLGLFFVCPGVEVIKYLGLVESHWLSLAAAIVGSSAITLLLTAVAGGGMEDHAKPAASGADRE
jgi:holin-like protein